MRRMPYYAPNITMPAEYAKYQQETEWVPLEEEPKLDGEDLRKAIGLRQEPCPLCAEGVCYYWLDHKGTTTGVVWPLRHPCECLALKWFWKRWIVVPAHDRAVANLATLAPTSRVAHRVSIDRQAKIIEWIKAKPSASCVFSGPAGSSKTTWAIAMYREMLWQDANFYRFNQDLHLRDEAVWHLSAAELFRQHHLSATSRDAPEPDVTLRRILKLASKPWADRRKPRLFLEEIDKVSLTDFKRNVLFELVDAIYGAEGQIVITSNMSREEFSTSMGAPVARRLRELRDFKWADIYLKPPTDR